MTISDDQRELLEAAAYGFFLGCSLAGLRSSESGSDIECLPSDRIVTIAESDADLALDEFRERLDLIEQIAFDEAEYKKEAPDDADE